MQIEALYSIIYRWEAHAVTAEITRVGGHLIRSRSFKVTDFGTNQKPACDLLLVNISE